MSTNVQSTVMWVVGMAASLLLMYLSYLSLQQGFTLSPAVIAGMLGLIILMAYGARPLADIIKAWKQ